MNRREFLWSSAAAGLSMSRLLQADPAPWEQSIAVSERWFGAEKELSIPAQLALLKKIGYGGMTLTLGPDFERRMPALRESGLELLGLEVSWTSRPTPQSRVR